MKKLCVGLVTLGLMSIASPGFANVGVGTATLTFGGAEQGVAWHGACQLTSWTERLSQSPERLYWGVITADVVAYRPGDPMTPVTGRVECFLRTYYYPYDLPHARVGASSSSGVFIAAGRVSYEAAPDLQLCVRLNVEGPWWGWEQCSPLSTVEV